MKIEKRWMLLLDVNLFEKRKIKKKAVYMLKIFSKNKNIKDNTQDICKN